MTIFTLAKTDTYKTSAWRQNLKLPVLTKDVTKIQIQIGFRKVQQIAQLTDEWISSQCGGKLLKFPIPAPFKI
jgi:hypothetical protein